jgi:hypothetical protein
MAAMRDSRGRFVKGGGVTVNDRTAEALRSITGRAQKEFTIYVERMVELAKRPPPEGSPVAGVFDSRLPPRPRKLIGMHGGNNRDSINFSAKTAGERIEFSVFTQSNYGAYLELGTTKMVAREYFAPGHEVAQNEFMERMPWA